MQHSTDNYNENDIIYDLEGNIMTLQRTLGSTTPIDNLSYTYTDVNNNPTNQVQSINDAAPDVTSGKGYKTGNFAYIYDLNGNLYSDASKVLTSTTYNLLNLPQVVTVSGKTATFTYDAEGTKMRKVSTISGVKTDYIDGIEYDGGSINFIQTGEGRVFPSSGNYEYNLSDHLGDVRYSFDTHIVGTASPVQQDDYYPFGYEISRSLNGVKNEYLYNKKELQEDLQTDVTEFANMIL